jgi:hypothetical protein
MYKYPVTARYKQALLLDELMVNDIKHLHLIKKYERIFDNYILHDDIFKCYVPRRGAAVGPSHLPATPTYLLCWGDEQHVPGM